MHAFKQTNVDKKALGLQYSTYHCYTCCKISVLVVLIIEEYDLISSRPSVEACIHLFFFSVFFITPLHKNACNSFVVHPIELYLVPS